MLIYSCSTQILFLKPIVLMVCQHEYIKMYLPPELLSFLRHRFSSSINYRSYMYIKLPDEGSSSKCLILLYRNNALLALMKI